MLGTLPRALRRALILPAALALLVPSAASAADELALIDKTEPLGPGITLRHLKTVDATGWYDQQVLTADLSNAAVKSDSLWAGKVAQGGPLSEAADDAGAVAGVNADFFDIGNSTAALGGQILGGTLLKSPDGGTGWNHAGVGKDGIGRLVDMTLEASATLKGTTHRCSRSTRPTAAVCPRARCWPSPTRGAPTAARAASAARPTSPRCWCARTRSSPWALRARVRSPPTGSCSSAATAPRTPSARSPRATTRR